MLTVRANQSCFFDVWNQLRLSTLGMTALYTQLDVEYLKNYPDTWYPIADLSMVVLDDRKEPIAGVLMAVKPLNSEKNELSAFGWPIVAFYHAKATVRERAKAAKILYKEIAHAISDYKISHIIYRSIGDLNDPLAHALLNMGACATPVFTQKIDLTQEISELWIAIRESYKRKIRWGQKHLNIDIVDSTDSQLLEKFNEYRHLHRLAAGRQTRSDKTWELNYRMLQADEAFLVCGRLDGRMVTGSLFKVAYGACYYGSGASDRSLFDKSLSHVVMWTAIAHAKQLGLQTLEVGEVVYPHLTKIEATGDRLPTEKEVTIGHYKKGFGGQTDVSLTILWRSS